MKILRLIYFLFVISLTLQIQNRIFAAITYTQIYIVADASVGDYTVGPWTCDFPLQIDTKSALNTIYAVDTYDGAEHASQFPTSSFQYFSLCYPFIGYVKHNDHNYNYGYGYLPVLMGEFEPHWYESYSVPPDQQVDLCFHWTYEPNSGFPWGGVIGNNSYLPIPLNPPPTLAFHIGSDGSLLPAPPIITIISGEGGTVSVYPASGNTGSTTQIIATPSVGYIFASWTLNNAGGGSISSTEAATAIFTFGSANATVTANFTQIPKKTGTVIKSLSLQPSEKPNLALIIHGYTPPTKTPYSDDAAMPSLVTAIQNRVLRDGIADQWDVLMYNWASSSGGLPQWAVANAVPIGNSIGTKIANVGYKKVLLIGWSAGTWLEQGIATALKNNGIEPSVIFLDAFIPNLFSLGSQDNFYTTNLLGAGLSKVEQYYETDSYWGVGYPLPNAVNYDITPLLSCVNFQGDHHAWPPLWYEYTVEYYNYIYGFGYGYPKAFLIDGEKGSTVTLTCDTQSTFAKSYKISQKDALNNAERQPSSSSYAGTELFLTNINTKVTADGIGTVISAPKGLQFVTTNFVWAGFNIVISNGCTFAAVDYTFASPCEYVVGFYLDGQAIQFIQGDRTSSLASVELFPLPVAVNSGSHYCNIALESLDQNPVFVTVKAVGFYSLVTQPQIASESKAFGNFAVQWEASAGLKYQLQCNVDLVATNWNSIGEVLTCSTNSIMSVHDTVMSIQRFYRLILLQ